MTPSGSELDVAYRACAEIARKHYENFPVASLLVPRRARKHLSAIYAFARGADDLADEPDVRGDRIALLNEWEARLLSCVEEPSNEPVFLALGNSIREENIPIVLLQDLVKAFQDDVRNPERQTFGELLEYSKGSANPVGRLVLWVCGYRDEERARFSDAICTALQLTNFWQDVGVDRQRGRVYLPREEMERFGYTRAELENETLNEAFRLLMGEMISRTRSLFQEGLPLCGLLRGRLAFEIRLTWLSGNRILDKIEANDFDVFQNRPTLTKGDFAGLFSKTLLAWRSVMTRPSFSSGKGNRQ